jgi:hypothetical protein
MTDRIRDEWLSMLANLTYPANPAHAAQAFRGWKPLLADLPDRAFTRASLEEVVLAPRKMAIPSYDEIRKPLSAWWRDNRPMRALAAPRMPDPVSKTPADHEAVAAAARAAIAELRAADPVPVRGAQARSGAVSEGALLATYEALEAAGDPAAAIRAAAIRAKFADAQGPIP